MSLLLRHLGDRTWISLLFHSFFSFYTQSHPTISTVTRAPAASVGVGAVAVAVPVPVPAGTASFAARNCHNTYSRLRPKIAHVRPKNGCHTSLQASRTVVTAPSKQGR